VRRIWFLAALFLLTGCYSGSRPKLVGDTAKDFTLQDSDRTVSLNQFRGQVVVLNFWATWCPPCVEELPSLMNMQERMKGRGVVVVGVSIDTDSTAYHRFLKERGINFLTVQDPGKTVPEMYGTTGWPETFIIDRQGLVRRKFIGAVDWSTPEVTEFLSKL
jgi:cytochrome c biogenesis protein CcmG, thiol:disulfide interchange protein DsbE